MSFRRWGRHHNHLAGHDNFVYKDGDLQTVETKEDDGLDVEFKLRVLADLLLCQLCGGFFRDAATVRECLHTFCRGCLLYYYQLGGRKCPICGEVFTSSNINDAIQSDVTIQNLVDKMLPCLAQQERAERTQLAAFCGLVDPPEELPALPIVTARRPFGCGSAELPSKQQNTSDSSIPFASLSSTTTQRGPEKTFSVGGRGKRPATGSGWSATDELYRKLIHSPVFSTDMVSMKIKLEPASLRLPDLPRPFLRTSPKMHIAHLSRYIAGRLRISEDEADMLEIIYDKQVLPRSHSLEFVCRSRRTDPCKGVHCFQYNMRQEYTPLTSEEIYLWGKGVNNSPLLTDEDVVLAKGENGAAMRVSLELPAAAEAGEEGCRDRTQTGQNGVMADRTD